MTNLPVDGTCNRFFAGLWGRTVRFKQQTRGVLAIGGLIFLVGVLLTQAQGSDLVLSIAEPPRGLIGGALITAVASLFLGGQAWFWSRRLIDRNTDGAIDYRDAPLLLIIPQLLGLAPAVLAAVVIVLAHGPRGSAITLVAALATAVLAILLVRAWLKDGEGSLRSPEGRRAAKVNTRLESFARFVRVASLLLAALTMVLVVLQPVAVPQTLGSVATVYFAVGLIIPLLACAFLATFRSRFPVTEALFIWAALISGAGCLRDNHEVGRRTFGREVMSPAASVATLEAVYDAWYAQAPGSGTREDPKPLVIVAIEGGASRAAYWTAQVLGELEKRSKGDFSKSVVALSSVSGGSVGAVAFASVIHDQPTPDPEIEDAVTEIAAPDFLSPALAGLLFPDLLQRFLPTVPIPGFHGKVFGLPDRAEPLEKALEASWRAHCHAMPARCTHPDLWGRPMLAVAPGVSGKIPRWTPAVFVNGAREEDGRRVLTATAAVDPAVFPDALDFRLASRGDPAISTAIVNGARFPLVSPGGTLVTPDGAAHGHLLDGGYFEGSGVSTARDLLRAMIGYARARTQSSGGRSGFVHPILIEINNDSDADPGSVRLFRGKRPSPNDLVPVQKPASTKYFLNDVMGPLLGVSQSRDGRGAAVAAALSDEMSGAQASDLGPWGVRPAYILIHLCKKDDRGMPMDWALSNEARDIAHWALSNCGNGKPLDYTVDAVHRPAAAPPAPQTGRTNDS